MCTRGKNAGPVYHTYLDVDEICGGQTKDIPLPMESPLPEWINDQTGSSGTLVVWSRCDRIDNRRAATIIHKLHGALGRKFRYPILSGIKFLINGENVAPIDPLYCHPHAMLRGAFEYQKPLEYELRRRNRGEETSSIVRVRFSLLPVHEWHSWSAEQKRRFGISGGAGVSIVRAKREIAYGWYFLRGKRKQNYDDWWRCEIQFDATLDEWFGVSHSKQGISPTPELNDVLAGDIMAIANELNAQVRKKFAQIKVDTEPSSIKIAARNDWRLPPVIRDNTQSGFMAARQVGAKPPVP